MENRKRPVFEGVLLCVNVVLVFILLVKLHTTPSDVYEEVQHEQAKDRLILNKIVSLLEIHEDKLDGRKQWMDDLYKLSKESSNDRWKLKDEKKTWEQVFNTNPNLAKPYNFFPENKRQEEPYVPFPPE